MKKALLLFFYVLIFENIFAQFMGNRRIEEIAMMEKKAFAKIFTEETTTQASGNFTVHYYRCEWVVDPAINYIRGKVTAYFDIISPVGNIVFDLSHLLDVDSVSLHNNLLSFSQSLNETVSIDLGRTYNEGEKDSLSIYYNGAPDTANSSFVQSTHEGVPVLWTLSEPYGAKDWWPCRNGLDDKADSIDIYITHPSAYRASSNGLLQSETANGNTTVTHYKHHYPIASYLVAMAVTNYSVFTQNVQLGNISLPVISYAYPEDLDDFQNRTYLMIQALQLYHSLFGDYPFINERYGQTQFGLRGGMEHQTNSFIGSTNEDLMAHELAHQWFGDKVTCASWEDIWLNEGFAAWSADFLYMKNFSPAYYNAYVEGGLAGAVSKPDGSVWVDDTTSASRIFDGRLTYAKGGFLVRMLEWTLGDSLFFKGIRQYLEDPEVKYGFAHVADLQRNLEAISGMNLDYFFRQWFYGQGYPTFTVQWRQNLNNYAHINISQATSHPSVKFYRVPLQIVFKNATQQKAFIIQDTINNQEQWLDIGFKADSMLIDPDHYLLSKDNKAIKVEPSSLNPDDIQIYPNPFVDKLIISIKNPTEKKWQILLYNVAGQRLLSTTFDTPGADAIFTVRTPSLPHGIYLLRIDSGKTKITKKLVK